MEIKEYFEEQGYEINFKNNKFEVEGINYSDIEAIKNILHNHNANVSGISAITNFSSNSARVLDSVFRFSWYDGYYFMYACTNDGGSWVCQQSGPHYY